MAVAATEAMRIKRIKWDQGGFLALAALLIVILAALAISDDYRDTLNLATGQLQGFVHLKRQEISEWLKERQGDAEYLRDSRILGEEYRRWQAQGEAAGRRALEDHLEQLRLSNGYRAVLLFDPDGRLLWDSAGPSAPPTPSLSPSQRAALFADAARRPGWPQMSRDADGRLHLDFAATLPAPQGAQPVVVLRADPADRLFKLLRVSARFDYGVGKSIGIALFRRDGEQISYLNDLRYNPGSALTLRVPIASGQLLAARLLRGEVKTGQAITGVDLSGRPALGVASAVPGSDWMLMTMLRRANINQRVWPFALWISLTGFTLLLLAAAIGKLTRQGRRQRQQAERLRELELLEALAESTEDGLIVKDVDGRYLMVNSAFCRTVGKTRKEVLGQDSNTIFPPDEAARIAALDRRMIDEGGTLWVEERLTTVQGPRLLRITKGPLHDAEGKVSGLFGIFHDITDQQRDQEQLRILSQAVEQSPESIVITNIDAKIEYVNAAFLLASGYTREEVLGKNPRILHSGKTPAQTYETMWATLGEGRIWKGEFHNRRRDGSEYLEFASIAPIRAKDGRVTHYLAVKEDISEKKRLGLELDRHRHHLEELVENRTRELEAARVQAESASLAKSAFLANMSHEIRTPMNAIIGFTHLLRRTRPSSEQDDKLARIESAASHLLAIINDILDLSKIEAGRVELEQTIFSPAAILDQVRSLIGDRARAKDLALKLEIQDDALWLCGDAIRIRQALLNYADNAVKFTERGGITLRCRILDEADGEVGLRFEVEDTGIGIAADKLPELFQPFVQADVSTTRRFGGTGLGLAISRNLARLMGGDAGAESEPGGGSLFWFSARFARCPDPAPVAASVPASLDDESRLRAAHPGARLLLAEDNAVNRELALELIRAVGLDADSAADGREAVAMAAATNYALILMDVQMPEMNGLDATRAIRGQPANATVPILAMTADAFSDSREACRQAGMDDFIAKPVEPAMLYAALLKWLPAASVPKDPAPAAPDTQAALRQVDGLDFERTLALMHGKQTSAIELLIRYAEACATDAGTIAKMLAADDLAALKPLAYSLRGTALMIGATKPAAAADALLSALDEAAAKSGLADSLADALSAELSAELSELAAAIDRATAGHAGRIGQSRQLATLLAQLEELLERGDLAASHLAREEAGALLAMLGETGRALLARIEAFDFEAAGKLLREFRAKQTNEGS